MWSVAVVLIVWVWMYGWVWACVYEELWRCFNVGMNMMIPEEKEY